MWPLLSYTEGVLGSQLSALPLPDSLPTELHSCLHEPHHTALTENQNEHERRQGAQARDRVQGGIQEGLESCQLVSS